MIVNMAKRNLSKEDQELWKKVKESATPLDQRKNLTASPKSFSKKEPQNKYIMNDLKIRPILSPTLITLPPAQDKTTLKMDQKAFKRMTRGRLKPEATLDLHGSTLAQAHALLVQFIQRNFHANRRLVLVITGKGIKHSPLADEREGYGILRKQAPIWLSSPPCKDKILHVCQAHVKHGGSGALYVYLTRNKTKI